MIPLLLAASLDGGRSGRGKLAAVAMALAALGVVLAAGVLVWDEIAALWYEHRLDHGPEAERDASIRRLAETRTDRGLRRVIRILLEEPPARERRDSGILPNPIKGLISVDAEADGPTAAASEALAGVGPRLLPVATAVITEVVARGDPGELERTARSLGPLVVPLGHLENWTRPVTSPWIEGLKRGHRRAASAAEELQSFGVASVPALLEGLDSDEWFLARWSESILWQMAQKSKPACLGLLHAHARADERRQAKLARVLESAGEEGRNVLESALAGRDPRLSRAAREVLEEIAAARRNAAAR